MVRVLLKGVLNGLFSHSCDNISCTFIIVKRIERAIKKAPNSANELWCDTEMWR